MEQIAIRPHMYAQFGPSEGAAFCLVTNTELLDVLAVERTESYDNYMVLAYDKEGEFERLMDDRIPPSAHVLVVSPKCFFRSPELVGPRRKLIAMACNSTPTPLEAVDHFLKMLESTRPDLQQTLVDDFMARGSSVDHVTFVNQQASTRAVFNHMNEAYEWNVQAGTLGWGEQQIAPSGEVSVLPADIWQFKPGLTLSIDGEIAFRGLPILHSGEGSFLRSDQKRIFDGLKAMIHSPVIATVENGTVTRVRAFTGEAEPAVRMLEALFAVDSRYRVIWEIGFAVNTTLEPMIDNLAMNEVYGSENGCLHFGIGLTPYTQYHLDIICPDTNVLLPNGDLLFGGVRSQTRNVL